MTCMQWNMKFEYQPKIYYGTEENNAKTCSYSAVVETCIYANSIYVEFGIFNNKFGIFNNKFGIFNNKYGIFNNKFGIFNNKYT
jgi:hypothetical protein